MRTVDLAVYADTLAARSSALAARLEHARAQLRQAAIEHEARRALGHEVATRLEPLGLFADIEAAELRRHLRELTGRLEALDQLQVWVEARLALLHRDEESGAPERRAAMT